MKRYPDSGREWLLAIMHNPYYLILARVLYKKFFPEGYILLEIVFPIKDETS